MDMTNTEKELEFEAWETFKQAVRTLKGYRFEKYQLQEHIRIVYEYDSSKKSGNDYVVKGSV